MPRIVKLLGKISAARERHRERHRPTGFGFALADRIDYLNTSAWDAVVATSSFFLGRAYLRALEDNAPANLVPRYAIVFRDRTPVAAVVVQLVRVAASQFLDRRKQTPHRVPAANVIVRSFLWAVPHDEAPDRSPFKP
ncbi:MAG: hypothetical protein HYR85_08935 [Planctomycetes bacterium]|nr:hypothetical protein [Planctomycetota bacterium]MBI3844755.1 hypothetical protein [Planctomycetota bacterium]